MNARHQPEADAATSAVVVGGGIAGLTAAHDLRQRGFTVTVLEASPHFGGCVTSHEVAGLTLDAGAESFSTRSKAVADLAAELGLRQDIVYPAQGGAWLQLPGADPRASARPLPATGILGIPANPRDPDVVHAIGNAAAIRAALDKVMPLGSLVKRERVSLAEVVRERMGDQVLNRLVTPIAAGVFSSDPSVLDVDVVAPGLRAAMAKHGSLGAAVASIRADAPAGSAVSGLTGGMSRLTTALVDTLRGDGARLLTDARVTAIRESGRTSGARWAVRTAGNEFPADVLVMATDGPAAVDLLGESVPQLKQDMPAAGAGVALVTLVVDLPELDVNPRGTGVLVAPGVIDQNGFPVVAKALTHATAKWQWLSEATGPGSHVLRLSYGRAGGQGEDHPETWSDEKLYEQALADAGVLLGLGIRGEDVVGWDVVRWVGALPAAAVGHRDRVARVRASVAGENTLEVVGAWLSGTGLAAVVGDTRARMRKLADAHCPEA